MCGNKENEAGTHTAKRRKRILMNSLPLVQASSLQYLLATNEVVDPFINNTQHFVLEAAIYLLLKDTSFHFIMDAKDDLTSEELFQQCLTLHEEVKTSPSDRNCIDPCVFQVIKLLIRRWLTLRRHKSCLMKQINILFFFNSSPITIFFCFIECILFLVWNFYYVILQNEANCLQI